MRNSNISHSSSNLVGFYSLEKGFFKNLARKLHQDQETMRWVMSLWLWLESIGFYDFIRRVSSSTDDVILSFIEEAIACLKRMKEGNNGNRGDELPNTTTFVDEPINLRFFDYHRDFAIVGVRSFFENVTNSIFDGEVIDVIAEDGNHPLRRQVMSNSLNTTLFGKGTSQEGLPTLVEIANSTPTIGIQSLLNPIAEPWSPIANVSPQDQRSIFITFSRGYPLSEEEITEFFTLRYGDCIEKLMIENAPSGSTPVYGRMICNSTSMIALILNGQQTAKFVIRGKHLWARMFTPHHSRNPAGGEGHQ